MKLKLCTALLTAATLFAPLSVFAEKVQNSAEAKRAAVAVYGKLPLSFEPTDSTARFVAHSGGYTVAVGARESSVVVANRGTGKGQTLHFAFENANPAASLEAIEAQPGVTNYYLGQDSAKWRLGVKHFAKLRAQGVYPGVDVIYYGDHRRLEFDFVVAPKSDPRAIALSFSGMEKLYKDANGDLVAEIDGQPVRFVKPYAYQKVAGVSKPVQADYELAASGSVHLRVGDYDSSSELIIDPVVSYATYLGGSATDVGNGIAVDSTGAAYVTGQTCSSDFPVSSTNANGLFSPTCDAYVTKFSPDGTTFDYTTIIGGSNSGTASGNGIALDSSNQAYIIGATNFTDLPDPDTTTVYTNDLNTWRGGDSDAFISILDAATGAVIRNSYLGGSGADSGYAIAVDKNQNVIAVGQTCSDNFPAYNAFQTKIEPCVAFITKLDNGLHIATPTWGNIPGLPRIIAMAPPAAGYYFSGFFGGQPVAPIETSDWVANKYFPAGSIIQDTTTPVPNIEITFGGGTSGLTEPVFQTTALTTTADNTITWENLGPVALIPDHNTWAYGVALDPLGDVFVAGGTTTPNIVSSVWPFETFLNAGTGAWVIKVNGQATGKPGAWVYGSALENTVTTLSAIDAARAIAVDASGRAYVTGTATGTLLGTSNSSYKSAVTGGQDAFLVRMNTNGSAIDYATYLGGTGDDQGLGVAVDSSGAAYVTGSTKSGDFPTINPLTFPNGTPLQTVSGGQDAFITKFTTDGSALIFSAYLGGSDLDLANAIAVAIDPNNASSVNMFVAGNTYSTDLEELDASTYSAPQSQYGTNGTNGSGDAFVAMVAGSSLATATVTPGTLNFPAQDVNTSSVPGGTCPSPECIQYTNTNSTSTITISRINFSNGEFAQFPMSGSSPGNCTTGVVAPNSACDLWVVFTPAGQGSRIGTVTITDDASTTPHVVDLTGQGTVPQDALSASSLTFGNQGVSTQSITPQSVTLQNIGSGTLYITSIAIDGVDPGDFSLTNPNPCGTQLAVGASCTISVTFTPSVAGKRAASLTITDNAAPDTHTIGLSGTGVLVASTVAPGTLAFPQQAMNVASTPQTITVTNTDPTQSLVVSTPTTTGDYKVGVNNCTAPVLPAGSCTILVVFDPTLPGTRNGTVIVSGNGTVMPVTVTLTGTAGATATLSPNLTFVAPNNVGTTSPALAVTLANQSNFAFNVQPVVISGAAASEFSQTNNCGTSVSANGSCTILVSFTPTATGNQNATLSVTSDAAGSPQSISIVGVGTAPLVTFAPPMNSTVNFGNQPLNAASSSIPITLTNSGSGPLNIPAGGITMAGTAASDFSQTNTCGTQLAVGASCAISVVFTPSAINSRSASLVIADDAIPNPQTIALLGAGVQVKTPTIAPASLSFANQLIGSTSAVQTATVTNIDPTYTLSLSSAVASGDFQVVAQPGSCGKSLAPNGTCVIGVTFTPTASGTRTGTLTIATNGSSAPLTVQLTGLGGAAATISPTSLNLGNTNVGGTSTAQTVTLTNTSTFPVNITGVTMSGASSSQFFATNNCGTVVSASTPCTVSVVFKPTSTGTQTATMTVTSDAATPFAPVSLTGNGTTPVVTLSTQSLTFPDQALNAPSASMPIKLSNSGTGPLDFTSISISGAAPTDFSQTNTCGLQVLAGASCTINVIFNPTALNSRVASLIFTDDAANSPQTVTLSGNGIAGSGVLQLSPATVAFGNQQVNIASSIQKVTVANTSTTAALTINSMSFSGTYANDFAGASNCPTTLAANSSCQILVNFTPSAAVAESATLTVTGSATNSPQSVALTGTGTTAATTGATPFTVTPDPTSSTGASITQGGTATYVLDVTPLNGYNSPITFTCSGPAGSSCSASPNPVTVAMLQSSTIPTVTVTVNTNGGNGTTANARFGARSIFLALLPFSMMGILLINKKRGCWLALLLVVLCLLLGLVGCGAGSASSTSGALAPGSYQVIVTATSGANTQNIPLNLVVNKQ